MPPTSAESEFVSYIVELMQSIGPVRSKGMFGGYGIFIEELMFGLVADNTLYLKADNETVNEFRDKGLEQFTYNKNGKKSKMSYYQAPEEILEDKEEMNIWANKAYNVALRAASMKRSKIKST